MIFVLLTLMVSMLSSLMKSISPVLVNFLLWFLAGAAVVVSTDEPLAAMFVVPAVCDGRLAPPRTRV